MRLVAESLAESNLHDANGITYDGTDRIFDS